MPPKQAKFETDKDKLRQSIQVALSTSGSFEDFKKALMQNYGIDIKESRGRYSYLTTDRTKPITARKLGDDFDKTAVLAIFAQNAARAAEQTAPIPTTPLVSKTVCRGGSRQNHPGKRQHKINKVLKHYANYIAALSTRRLFDEFGRPFYCVDETLKRRLETKLITKILEFEIAG